MSADELSIAASNNSSASSALSSLKDLISTADTDGDGSLAGPEFESAFNQLSSDMQSTLMSIQEDAGDRPSFSDLDTDSSSSLSFEEFAAGAPDELSANTEALQQLYTSIDTDGDGSVSQDEFNAFIDAASPSDSSSSTATSSATDNASTENTSSSSGTGGSSSASGTSSTKEVESETTVTSPDGSTTTTITYTDGTSTTTTTPPSPNSSTAQQNGEAGTNQPGQGKAPMGPATSAYEAMQSSSTESSASLDVAA